MARFLVMIRTNPDLNLSHLLFCSDS